MLILLTASHYQADHITVVSEALFELGTLLLEDIIPILSSTLCRSRTSVGKNK